jgi:hypothetical protein
MTKEMTWFEWCALMGLNPQGKHAHEDEDEEFDYGGE